MRMTTVSERSVRTRVGGEADAMRSVIEASRIAREIGFSASDVQSISTAASELVRNILKYAGKGQLSIKEISADDERPGIEIAVTDRGPGIEDIEAAMSDHFSSSGTLGLGLPGVKRMMDEFEIESAPGRGTRVVVRKYLPTSRRGMRKSTLRTAAQKVMAGRRTARPQVTLAANGKKDDSPAVDCASVIRPFQGESVSGDAAVVEHRDGLTFAAIVDALGHGPLAHRVALKAVRYLKKSWSSDLMATVDGLHEALQGTEGVAAGLCVIDFGKGTGRYVGIGNTVMRVFGEREKRLFSTPGTLGHQMRSPREQSFSIQPDDVVVMYTDGVKERFELKDYPQLRFQKAEKVSSTVVEKFGKHHDDAGCIVMRQAR
jgi:anti-sigma regulatory factor (Ser/Thr protein kinase)